MVSGSTKDSVSLLEASKMMHKNTVKQAKSKGKKLSKDIRKVYDVNDKLMCHVKNSKIPLPYEPKMNNRWYVKFSKDIFIPEWVVESVTRPSYPFNVGGKIHLLLRDPIAPSTSKCLVDFLKNPKPFKLKIELVDPLGEVVETWVVKGCVIVSVDWSPLDYTSNDATTIHVEISYNEVKFKNI